MTTPNSTEESLNKGLEILFSYPKCYVRAHVGCIFVSGKEVEEDGDRVLRSLGWEWDESAQMYSLYVGKP